MVELSVQPKRKSQVLLAINIIAFLALLFLLARGCDGTATKRKPVLNNQDITLELSKDRVKIVAIGN